MKNRPRDKKAGIIILAALIIVSLAEIIFRAATMGEKVLTTSNLGEQFTVIAIAVAILILGAKGKDRICYILYGAWIGFFAFNQLFLLPGKIITFVATVAGSGMATLGHYSFLLTIFSIFGIMALGILLIEYVNDGSIYNRAFNVISIATVLIMVAATALNILSILNGRPSALWLAVFDNVRRLIMVFMFTFFAYDSAKIQLKKVKFS